MSNQLSNEELTFGEESLVPVIMSGLTLPLYHAACKLNPQLLSWGGGGLRKLNMFNECSKVIN